MFLGLRVPFLRVGWNRQFLMMSEFGFNYDSSIVAPFSDPPFWPYTMDQKMPHECVAPGQICPTRPYRGIWEIPLNPAVVGVLKNNNFPSKKNQILTIKCKCYFNIGSFLLSFLNTKLNPQTKIKILGFNMHNHGNLYEKLIRGRHLQDVDVEFQATLSNESCAIGTAPALNLVARSSEPLCVYCKL